MKHPIQSALPLFSLLLGACSSLGGGGGGGDNLPNRGISPYERLGAATEESPATYSLTSSDTGALIYVEPHAELIGEALVLFAEARNPKETTGHIVRCALNDALQCKADPEPVLLADETWLEGRAGAPSLAWSEQEWLMAYAFGQGAGIALATSADASNFSHVDEALLVSSGPYEAAGVDAPSLVATPEGLRLYYEGRDDEGVTRILFGEISASQGLYSFERRGVALDIGVGCEDVNGQPETCWDALAVGSPEVRRAFTGANREVYRLFYTGYGPSGFNLGFAASWNGADFERFLYNPNLASEAVVRQPSNVLQGERYLLFFEERTSNTLRGIAAAVNAPEAPSEHF